ncbi:FADH2 O2-dependent halogenase [Nocardia tenerifensis]|uniref:FADH2 O2-dependent halogenase n=1 Tax=Nocardia tenerifensis TaxID=228006 RepID=A0A318KZG6_9NOCA|nr:tryptophan 7-halogenase [Nocardia tenerifensis]PXX71254.1 FADH2 O2-dependent halogenase [Nocardia tenerifensis]
MQKFDVLILGSGLSGSSLSLCLQASGLRTCMVDPKKHPRFAIGESTIPNTSKLYKLMSIKYGVPELAVLSSFDNLIAAVDTCGMKNNFGFVYHEPGGIADRAHQFPLSEIVETESHLFRADVDHWLALRAVDYGAVLLEGVGTRHFEITDEGVLFEGDEGTRISAEYVVDAGGRGSPVADALGLRTTEGLITESKSIFTHMTGVTPFDDITAITAPRQWHTGTLHHVFEGGWMWVIPFDNSDKSSSPLCSVGITWRIDDGDESPERDPAQAFADFLQTYPEIGKQFEDARNARDWISAGRLQYSSRRTVGDRWCLTSNAAGFIDPLFSRGMQNTAVVVDRLAERLIDRFRGGFTPETFDDIEQMQASLIKENDFLVGNAFRSFTDYELWNAWFRVWQVNQVTGTMRTESRLRQVIAAAEARGEDTSPLLRMDAAPGAGLDGFIDAFYEKSGQIMDAYWRKEMSRDAAVAEFGKLFADADFVPPSFGLTDMSQPYFDIDIDKVAAAVAWARRARPGIRELYLNGLPASES